MLPYIALAIALPIAYLSVRGHVLDKLGEEDALWGEEETAYNDLALIVNNSPREDVREAARSVLETIHIWKKEYGNDRMAIKHIAGCPTMNVHVVGIHDTEDAQALNTNLDGFHKCDLAQYAYALGDLK